MSTPTFSMQVKGLFQPNTPKTTASPDLKLLTIWNGVTALVHAGIACFFIYTAISENDNVARDAPLVRIASCWDVQEDHSTPPMPIFDIRNEFVDTGGSRKSTIVACIITFHLLSAAFQGIPWFLYFQRHPFFVRYFNSVIGKNGAQVIRYTEYTVSAPLMVVAIGLSYGILDVYTLLGLGALTAVCMQFGLAADVMRVQARDTTEEIRAVLKPYMYYFHMVSWATIIIPWVVIIHVFEDLRNNTYRTECNIPDGRVTTMPDAIFWVVFGEAFLFSLFGFVQVWQIWYFKNDTLKFGTRVEWLFVLLSLVSKTSLGLTIYSSSIFT
jgi:hypothetical protein